MFSTNKSCPHRCAVRQLHCRNVTQARWSRQGTLERCYDGERQSFRPDSKRDGELIRRRQKDNIRLG